MFEVNFKASSNAVCFCVFVRNINTYNSTSNQSSQQHQKTNCIPIRFKLSLLRICLRLSLPFFATVVVDPKKKAICQTKKHKNKVPLRQNYRDLFRGFGGTNKPGVEQIQKSKKPPKQRASLDRITEMLFRRFGGRPFAKPKNTKTTCLLRQIYRDFFWGLWLHK